MANPFAKTRDVENPYAIYKGYIDGIGEIQISSLRRFFSIKENLKVVKELANFLNIKNEIINSSGKLKKFSFMITGKLQNMSRAEAKSTIEKTSGKILS